MSELRKDSTAFIGYDYKEIPAGTERAAFYRDCYQCFGWVAEAQPDSHAKGNLLLKRERKIMNKAELTRLQRHFESCMDEIEALEHAKTSGARAAALSVGVVGTAFIAGSVFAVTHVPPRIILCILLAVPGFLGWILPWFLYKKMVFRRAKVVAELQEQKYDEIDRICEQGSNLLNG